MKRDIELARAPNLSVELQAAGVTVYASGRSVFCGPHGLEILAAFDRPKRYGDAIAELGALAKTPADWIELTGTIQQMVDAGALRDLANLERVPQDVPKAGYEHPGIHIEMLADRARTELFLAGIRAVVKPGDVVVDIGTGTGILAVAAAQAGASRVYAIEATRIADAAEAVIRGNGLADRVKVVRGWSTQVELPERADVLVTEMIGHEPLAEDALFITWDARKRLLKEGARMVPRAIRLFAYPAVLPEAERAKAFFTETATRNWKDWYGVDFSPLLAFPGPVGSSLKTTDVKGWRPLAPPLSIGSVDFPTADTVLELAGTGTISDEGDVGAIVLYFELELGPGVVLSTAPATAAISNHWRTPVWFQTPRHVTAGQTWNVRYRHSKPMGDLTFSVGGTGGSGG